MRKAILLFFAIVSFSTRAQVGTWTWISGDSTVNAPGVYGIQGVPSVNNHPQAGWDFVEWKDKQGDLWVYGGSPFRYGDLWRFHPPTKEWTWVKGSGLQNSNPYHGIKGVPSLLTTPGSRLGSAATWVDTSGTFWLFGSCPGPSTYYCYNDLWRYDPMSNEWTWMEGSDSSYNDKGFYGVQGVFDSTNNPGSRFGTGSAWTDEDNNLWLFGGRGHDISGTLGLLSDVWKYSISLEQWTWVSGPTLEGEIYNYGTLGITAPTNTPGGRNYSTRFTDALGNFWLMGGNEFGPTSDVWKYDLNNNLWTWMGGPKYGMNAGTYQTFCADDTTNKPAARGSHRSSVTDDSGNFWIFGGAVLYNAGGNDLWHFNSTTLKWNWLGANQPANYGHLGVPSSANYPPSRAGAVAWWGNDRKLYVFSGSNTNQIRYADLWVYDPDSICPAAIWSYPIADFSGADTICPGVCVSFQNSSQLSSYYQWLFPGASQNSSTQINPSNICYTIPGVYDVTLIASNGIGTDTMICTNCITVYAAGVASINQSGDTLFATAGFTGYQWYFNGSVVTGATDNYYIATQNGNYYVVTTDANGCEVQSSPLSVITSVLSLKSNLQLSVFPNPVGDELIIKYSEEEIPEDAEVIIFDAYGERIELPFNRQNSIINCKKLPAGIYFIKVITKEKSYRANFVKA